MAFFWFFFFCETSLTLCGTGSSWVSAGVGSSGCDVAALFFCCSLVTTVGSEVRTAGAECATALSFVWSCIKQSFST